MTEQAPAAGESDVQDPERPAGEPTFSEQLADQMGGGRGLIESGIPVAVFVLVNVVWSLYPALIASIGVAGAIVVFRLSRRQPIRHAINGLIGVGIGAFIAWKTGQAKDYYLPGIVMSFLYGGLLIVSTVARHPVIGYMWAVVSAGGKHWWRNDPRLQRTFGWLTLLWATMFLVKGVVQGGLYLANEANWLGVARLAMGYPPYLLMLGITVWAVRRVTHSEAAPTAP
ncbi:MAG: DUF3159 domain-containing protein [Micromonosporaceae bacterium]